MDFKAKAKAFVGAVLTGLGLFPIVSGVLNIVKLAVEFPLTAKAAGLYGPSLDLVLIGLAMSLFGLYLLDAFVRRK